MKVTVKELIDTCLSNYKYGCEACDFYEYKCYIPTYPYIPRDVMNHRKFKKEKELNKEVELRLDN